jgi:RNA polymerase sigma-70 factor (ECF subfamily)
LSLSYRVPAPIRPLGLAAAADAPKAEEPLDDAALIDAIIQGNTRRARQVYDRLIGAIERTLYRVLGRRRPDHDDLVQTTFEQVVLSLRRGRFARGCSLCTWASAVAAHVAFNALRSQRSTRRVFDPVDIADVVDDPDAVDPSVVGNAERDVSVRARVRAAQAHLTAMNPERAIVLILHDVLDHDLAEIAAMLGVSVAAAQSRLVRGRHEFMKRVEAEDTSPWGD